MFSGGFNVLIPMVLLILDYDDNSYIKAVYTLLFFDVIHSITGFYQVKMFSSFFFVFWKATFFFLTCVSKK